MLGYLLLLESDGDKETFTRLYRDNVGVLLSVARGYFPMETDRGEDAVHNVFLTVAKDFQKFSRFSCQEVTPYLVTCVKNACRDILRKERKYADWEAHSDADRGLVPQTDGLDEAYRRAVALIYALPDKYREVLELRLIDGLSNQEAARKLGISEDSAAQRYLRARRMVAEQLEKEGLGLG